jgi:AAA ATPase domain
MPENFFEPGKRSHCLFSPDLWCDVFNPSAPFVPFEFLCDVTPQLVGVVLPAPGGEAGEVWDRIYDTIERIWQDRQVGFHCERIDAAAWVDERPCAACGLVRGAQVVIIDLHGGDLRAAGFREMAAGSNASLQILKAFGEAPNKRVILLSCGRVELPAFYEKIFHWIDYAGADGQPDLDKLTREMEAIARQDLFQSGDVLRLDAAEFEDPPAGAAAEPAPASPVEEDGDEEEDWENRIRFLDEIPLAAPAAVPRTVHDQLAESLAKAEGLMGKGRHADAFQALQVPRDLRAADREGRLRALERECICRMGAKDLAEVYFRGLTGRDRSRFELSAWQDGTVAAARLTLRTADLQALLGAPQVMLYACDQLQPQAAEELRRQLLTRPLPARAALVVVGDCAGAVCRQLAELRADQVFDIHLSDLRRWAVERKSPLDSLSDRLRSEYRRQDDLFLCGLHEPVWAEGDFFGRQELLVQLQECLRSGGSFALYGLPRSGKSSLLWRLARQPGWEGQLLAMVDLESHAADRPADLYARTAWAVREAVSASGHARHGSKLLDLAKIGELFALPPAAPVEAFRGRFEADLRALVEAIRRRGTPGFQRLILLFDEIESILSGEHRAFLAQLQSLAQEGLIAIGMTGLGFSLHQELADRAFPLRNVQEHVLGGLNDEESSELVRSIGQRMYRYFDEQAVARIVRESGGQPLLLRCLCSSILEAAPRGGGTIGDGGVQPGAERTLEAGNPRRRLEWIFTEVERQFRIGADLLKEMARDKESRAGVRLSWLEQQTRLDRTALERHLQVLAAYGLVDVAGDRYQHRIALLSSWLQQRSETEP